ncbi:hypothetical protein [Streptomyces flavidovirens]|uniref:Uncharacterized protein n=1 Tax=Streptomyces flavidovirens TaxID=67298 RepID=A0ABW6RPU3_9ACTN
MRNTKAFKEAVAQTLTELAHRGVTLAPSTVEDTIEKNINTVAERLGIQVRSAWRYFDAAALAERLAHNAHAFEESSSEKGVASGAPGSPTNGRPCVRSASPRLSSPCHRNPPPYGTLLTPRGDARLTARRSP